MINECKNIPRIHTGRSTQAYDDIEEFLSSNTNICEVFGEKKCNPMTLYNRYQYYSRRNDYFRVCKRGDRVSW